MAEKITSKERESILIRMVLIFSAFFVMAFGITTIVPTEERLLPFVTIVLIGMFCSGIYASKKFARNYEEFLWGVVSILMLSIVFGIVFYQRYLLDVGVVQPVFNLISHNLLFWLPLTSAIGFSLYEILFSIKIKKPFLLHVKRFIGRMLSIEIYLLLVFVIFSILYFFLSSLVSERHIFTMLIFANLIAFMPTYLLIKNPKIRQFFSKLEKSEM
jgi:hypothetical protein